MRIEIFKCDACSNEIPDYNGNKHWLAVDGNFGKRVVFDMCESCYNRVLKILKITERLNGEIKKD